MFATIRDWLFPPQIEDMHAALDTLERELAMSPEIPDSIIPELQRDLAEHKADKLVDVAYIAILEKELAETRALLMSHEGRIDRLQKAIDLTYELLGYPCDVNVRRAEQTLAEVASPDEDE